MQVCYCDRSHEHFISKALMTGFALMAAIVHFQMCLFPPYAIVAMVTVSIYLSIHPSWQCFKGICSLLVNVIKGRWSVVLIMRLLSHLKLTGNSASFYHGTFLFLFQSKMRDFISLTAQLNEIACLWTCFYFFEIIKSNTTCHTGHMLSC